MSSGQNPTTLSPAAFLTTEDALQAIITTYVAIGSLGALIWDVIIHLPQDFKLATKHKINLPFVVYCISRLSSLAYLLSIVITSTAPIGDCSMIPKLSFTYTVALPSTLLLFVFRVCALYHNNKFAVLFFFSLWIGLLVSSILVPFGVSAYKISDTGYCMTSNTKLSYALMDLPPFVHDTIIFLATSWAFISNSYQDLSFKGGLRILIFGKYLPAFSKSILRDGQFYYLSTLLFNIAVLVIYRIHNPWLAPCTFAVPLFVLTNTLAGHIYRSIRFKVYSDHTITSSAIKKNLKRMKATSLGTGTSNPGSSNVNSRNPHKLAIVFQRSAIMTTSTTGTRPVPLDSPGESSSNIQCEGVGLDLEKGKEDDQV